MDYNVIAIAIILKQWPKLKLVTLSPIRYNKIKLEPFVAEINKHPINKSYLPLYGDFFDPNEA